jgi:ComF family protein
MMNPLVDRFLTVLAPRRCHFCAATGSAPACAACERALPWNQDACAVCAQPLGDPARAICGECRHMPEVRYRMWTAFRYAEPIAAQILGLKFHARLAGAYVLGTLMAKALARRVEPLPELIVPVPLHAARLRRRGYNQALEISRRIAQCLAVTVVMDAVQRVRPTPEQTRLDAAARRSNLRGAFAVVGEIRDRHVAIVDDVITTGATVRELAAVLTQAGARRVEAWAAARA